MKKTFLLFFLLLEAVIFPDQIRILYPNGGESVFFNKDIETIRWTMDKNVGDVVILLYQNGIKLYEIQKVVKTNPNINNQTFLWKFTPQIKEGKGYRVRIRSLKNLSINDFSDVDFIIKRK